MAGNIEGMELRLYDTKTRQLQPLTPVRPGHVGIYLCGPTVQGSPHIGHLRAAVCFDVLIRWLRRNDVDVTYIRNITDIDDKILNNASANGEPWWQLASRYEREFAAAYDALGLLPPSFEPRATAHILDQIQLVQRLLERGHAYEDGRGNVYFAVESQPDYGSLTHQHVNDIGSTEDASQQDAEIEAGKHNPRDFALWKAARPGEPETASWEAPWGRGRPGWHLECSAMSRRYLGEKFDIHGGGIDLRFPHHENEQAQSHAAGWDFANLWVHNAWVTMADEKMSKSLGNTLSLGHLLQDSSPAAVRIALGTVHYRAVIEWNAQTLERAEDVWARLNAFVADATDFAGAPETIDLPAAQLPRKFSACLNDDLNVAGAMAVIYEHMKTGRRALNEGDRVTVARELQLVRSMLDVLGIDPGSWRADAERDGDLERALDVMVTRVIAQRNEAREQKDWQQADALRDLLTEAGIVVEDGAAESKWRITND